MHGLAVADPARPCPRQVPPHVPGTICFTPSFWCWAQWPGPPARPADVRVPMDMFQVRWGDDDDADSGRNERKGASCRGDRFAPALARRQTCRTTVSLETARVAVETKGIDSLLLDDPEPAALLNEVEQAWLWECAVNRSGPRKMTYACVAISLLLMFVVGSLYVFYNQGVALLAEMQTLSTKQPDRRFGQLERQLLIARAELFEADASASCAQSPCPPGRSPVRTPESTARQSTNSRRKRPTRSFTNCEISISHWFRCEGRLAEFQQAGDAPVPGFGRLWNWAGYALDKRGGKPAPLRLAEADGTTNTSPAVHRSRKRRQSLPRFSRPIISVRAGGADAAKAASAVVQSAGNGHD